MRAVSLHPRPAPRPPFRWRRALGYVVLTAGTAAGALYAHHRLEADALPIRSVAVSGASTPERADEFAMYAAVPRHAPLFGVDPDRIAARVEEHPWVRSAQVRRVPPDALEVQVAERQPVAVAAVEAGVFLVDDAGVPFKRIGADDAVNYPVITGARADELPRAVSFIAMAGRIERDGQQLAELNLLKGRATLQLTDGTRAQLGHERWEQKLSSLRRALDDLEARGLRAENVYLDDDRRPERVAVRLRPPSEMTGDAGNQVRENGNTGAVRAAPLGG